MRASSPDRLFPANGRFHDVVRFEPHEAMTPWSGRQKPADVRSVLGDALDDVRGHTNVERAAALAGEKVDASMFHGIGRLGEARSGEAILIRHPGESRDPLPATHASR